MGGFCLYGGFRSFQKKSLNLIYLHQWLTLQGREDTAPVMQKVPVCHRESSDMN